mgnify:CR=1 FL=1
MSDLIFKVTVHDGEGLPRCWATGETLAEAKTEAEEAFEDYYGPKSGRYFYPPTSTQFWVSIDDGENFVPIDFEGVLQ